MFRRIARLLRLPGFRPATRSAALLLLLLAFAAGCATPAATPRCCRPTAAPSTESEATNRLAAVRRFDDRSLYQSESSWTTDQAQPMRLAALAGRPQVVAMFFASCQFTCPVLVANMRQIEAALSPETRSRVGFTLVSFDSRRDTPAALAAYREARSLPARGWTLLHGEPDDVLELAALLGVNFKQDARGDFSHSNLIVLLNADGEIEQRLVGLNVDSGEMVRRLEDLARP